MKATKKFIVLLLFVLIGTFLLSGCNLLSPSKTVMDTIINERGELVVIYSNGTSQNLGKITVEEGSGNNSNITPPGENDNQGGNDIVINTNGGSVAVAAAKAACSAVSIVATHTDGSSAGSGVIYKYNASDDGYFIITNYHVVYSASARGISNEIKVMLYGNEYSEGAMEAKYVGGSLNYDIAVLFVKNNDILKASSATTVTVADSQNVSIGDTAIAVGNARGEGISVTSGAISVDSENLEMLAADEKTTVSFRVMRTDAAVNRGNSGGGLFNDRGELIGIVNAKTIVEGVEGMGYAIPSTLACNVADNIIDNCYGKTNTSVKRALMGITVSISDSISIYNPETGKISIKETVVVTEVTSSSVLAGKIKADDIIKSVTLDGHETQEVTRQYHVIDYMLQARVGDTCTVVVSRNGQERSITFTITAGCIALY